MQPDGLRTESEAIEGMHLDGTAQGSKEENGLSPMELDKFEMLPIELSVKSIKKEHFKLKTILYILENARIKYLRNHWDKLTPFTSMNLQLEILNSVFMKEISKEISSKKAEIIEVENKAKILLERLKREKDHILSEREKLNQHHFMIKFWLGLYPSLNQLEKDEAEVTKIILKLEDVLGMQGEKGQAKRPLGFTCDGMKKR